MEGTGTIGETVVTEAVAMDTEEIETIREIAVIEVQGIRAIAGIATKETEGIGVKVDIRLGAVVVSALMV